MKYKYRIAIFFLLAISQISYSQPPKGTEIQELVKIAQLYESVPQMSFDLRYTYADSLTWTSLTDSMTANCKISYGRTLVSDSNFEMLRGDNYDVVLSREDTLVIVSKRMSPQSIFQMPLLDSIFREANVDSMGIVVYNDSLWRFNVIFKPDSYYSFFEMFYDPRTYLVSSVNYHARNETGAYGVPADHVVCATIYMTNYSTAAIDPALFNESKYFYQLNGEIFLQPAWKGYQLQTY